MHIIGTAGHVDHGKSSLVQALTGVNPDRWLEEQQRGMTLDLGFARLVLDGGIEAGIVDVPGHERFLHNMLAGAAGMELLLLVVAATEGVMPQTREHLAILRYLNVRRTIVAVTKTDLLQPDAMANSIAAIREELRGTLAEGAPFVAVSSVTGAGLNEIRGLIAQELAALPSRDAQAPVYLPIDRVFTLPGRGTIVTGTLMQGRIAAGDTVAIEPGGERVRVRSLQVFRENRESATGGTRVALNVPGVERTKLARGSVVSDKEFVSRSRFSVQFSPLPDTLGLLRRRTPVRAHIGSAEILGTLIVRDVPESEKTFDAELVLKNPVVAFPGVRFVLRRMSPKTLLGGGEIAAISTETESDDDRSPAENAIAQILNEAGIEAVELSTIAFRANLREEVALANIESLIGRGDTVRIARPEAYLSSGAFNGFAALVSGELEAIHEREPWAMGATSLQLSRTLSMPEPFLVRLLLTLVQDGKIAQRSGYFSLVSHEPMLSAAQRSFFDELLAVGPENAYLPASFSSVSAAVKASAIAGAQKALDMLMARGALVRIEDALYRGSQIAGIHARIEEFIDRNGRMTMAEFRDVIGTSRKYAVPLLEWFDSRGITVRSGDYRMLRTRRAGANAERV